MALLSKFVDKEALVVDKLELPEIKTKHVADILENLEVDGMGCLIGLGEKDIDERKTIYMSARNIPMVEVSPASQLNTYSRIAPEMFNPHPGSARRALREINLERSRRTAG